MSPDKNVTYLPDCSHQLEPADEPFWRGRFDRIVQNGTTFGVSVIDICASLYDYINDSDSVSRSAKIVRG